MSVHAIACDPVAALHGFLRAESAPELLFVAALTALAGATPRALATRQE